MHFARIGGLKLFETALVVSVLPLNICNRKVKSIALRNQQQSKILIPFDIFCQEVLNARDIFLKDLSEINPLFLEVDDIKSLRN